MSLTYISQYLDLYRNYLSGSLPIEMKKLMSLGILYIAWNNISSKISKSLGNCISLQHLYLHENLLQETIPSCLSSLRGIEEIDFSYNNLLSEIPTFFKNFPLLNILNLSFNDLEGEVPIERVFLNASGVSIIGNTRLCGGIIHLKLPLCFSIQKKKHKLSVGLKLTVPIVYGLVSFLFIVLLFLFIGLEKEVGLHPQ